MLAGAWGYDQAEPPAVETTMSRARLAALLACLLAAPAALADTPLELVPRSSGYKTKSISVPTQGAAITTADFVAAIMDCKNYPMTATYMGVSALEECSTLEKRADGTVAIYQRTGGAMGVSSRQYVLLLKVVKQTDTQVEIQWDLVKNTVTNGVYSGPFADKLNKDKDTVYTPYNNGGWKYDKTAGTINYWVTSDPGGSLPGFLQTDGAVMSFPKELLRVRWGVEAD